MKKILFGLFLYFFLSMTAEAVHYYAWGQDNTAAPVGRFPAALDARALGDGQNPAFNAAVLINYGSGIGSGVLIEPPAGHGDLEGRLVLTAAHVIKGREGSLLIHRTGFLTEPGEDELEGFIKPARIIPHKDFVKGDESTRQFDYGLIILREPIAEVALLRLPEEGSLSGIPSDIEIVGFGARYDENDEEQGQIDEGLRRRLFVSHLNKNYIEIDGKRVLALNFAEFIADKGKEIFSFPYSGDSGGPIFLPRSYEQILGIVSGADASGEYKYIHVTKADVARLLTPGGK